MCLAQQKSENRGKRRENMIFAIYRTKSNNSKLLEKKNKTNMLKAVEGNTHTQTHSNRKSTHIHTQRESHLKYRLNRSFAESEC